MMNLKEHMFSKTGIAILAWVCLSFPLTVGGQSSRLDTLPYQLTEKNRWELEGTYNRIQIERTGSERIICQASDGDTVMFDHKGNEIEANAAGKQNIKLKRETLISYYVVYDTTNTIMRISSLRYPSLSPTGQTLVVFPRAFIPKREYDWKINMYGNDSVLLWESVPPEFEEPAKSPDGLIPQINWPPQFSPNGDFFTIGFQNQFYMYNRKGLVWKYKDPDPNVQFNNTRAMISDDGAKTIANITRTHSSLAYLFDGKGKIVWERAFPLALAVWLDERYVLLAVDSGKLLVYDTQTHALDIPVLLQEQEHYEIKGVDYLQATGELALLIEKSRSGRGQQGYEKYIEAVERKDEKAIFESREEMEQKKLEVRLYEVLRR